MKTIHLINDLYQVVNKEGFVLYQGSKYLCKSYIKLCVN